MWSCKSKRGFGKLNVGQETIDYGFVISDIETLSFNKKIQLPELLKATVSFYKPLG